MEKINVFLDDWRQHPEGFVLARDAEECLMLLAEFPVHILSLDYDLGPGRPTGYDVVDAMIERRLFADHIYFHSSDPLCRQRMVERLMETSIPEHVQVHRGPMPR